jgi:hypothetical protein
MSALFGETIKQKDLDKSFLTGPGEDLVAKTLLALSSIPQFIELFGPYTPGENNQRWADYCRMDWSIRQLPIIQVFESQTEDKDSDNAFLNGNISIQIIWGPNFRRDDFARIPFAMRGILTNFFNSRYVKDMLDELYYIQRPTKVYGLNKYGAQSSFSPNTELEIENEMVPITVFDAKYRIDLRSWYRALEYMGRTKDDPFEVTLAPLTRVAGEYDGVDDNDVTQVAVQDGINLNNP